MFKNMRFKTRLVYKMKFWIFIINQDFIIPEVVHNVFSIQIHQQNNTPKEKTRFF